MTISLDMFQTAAVAVVMLLLGTWLRKKVGFLERFCIPAPVIGGLLFAVFSCILYATHVAELSFDETLKNVSMTIFFTTVGFQANFKTLKQGGLSLLLFLAVIFGLTVLQNLTALGISKAMGLDPLLGLCTGSIPMVGGHGTAGAFGPLLEDLGVTGATTFCTAAATFGLVMGSLMGGPLGERLIRKHDLLKTAKSAETAGEDDIEKPTLSGPVSVLVLLLAMGIGSALSQLLQKTGLTLPSYIGAMIAAAAIRNIGELSGRGRVSMETLDSVGSVSLSLFLGIAMITLKLWQLAELALPLLVLLAGQTVLMFLFAYFVVFRIMGRDYDAAVLCAGTCGFGMGATPNAMANMQALTGKYVPSVKAFLLVPIVGGMFVDFINSLVITFFVNIL